MAVPFDATRLVTRGEPAPVVAGGSFDAASGSAYFALHPRPAARRTRRPTPFLTTRVSERWPAFSPDGHWIAYISDETGQYEVFVAPHPGPGRSWQVSQGGGELPCWRRDGGEIVDANDGRLMSVAIDTRSSFRVEPPLEVAQRPPYTDSFAMAPDGERFVVINGDGQDSPRELHVVLNWQEELTRSVSRR